MTIEISKETESLIEKALASGNFDSAEHVIQYALGRTLTDPDIFEDEAFVRRAKAALARSKDDIDNGQVRRFTKENHHELYEDIIRRGEERARDAQDAANKQ